jgi:hypothetical protein
MTRIFHALLCCSLLTFTLAACAKTESPVTTNTSTSANAQAVDATSKAPLADVVRASAVETVLMAGSTAEASVRLNIADGYHINANPPTFHNLIATELKVEGTSGVVIEKPIYPKAVKKKFAFAQDQELAVYEGEVEIKLPLRADKGDANGTINLNATLRTQACDDQACYPPRTIKLTIPVKFQ